MKEFYRQTKTEPDWLLFSPNAPLEFIRLRKELKNIEAMQQLKDKAMKNGENFPGYDLREHADLHFSQVLSWFKSLSLEPEGLEWIESQKAAYHGENHELNDFMAKVKSKCPDFGSMNLMSRRQRSMKKVVANIGRQKGILNRHLQQGRKRLQQFEAEMKQLDQQLIYILRLFVTDCVSQGSRTATNGYLAVVPRN